MYGPKKINKLCSLQRKHRIARVYTTNRLERSETHRPGRNACTRSNDPLISIYFRPKKKKELNNITRVYILYKYLYITI